MPQRLLGHVYFSTIDNLSRVCKIQTKDRRTMPEQIDSDLIGEIQNEAIAREPLEKNIWFRPTRSMKKQVKDIAKRTGATDAQVLRAIVRLGLRRQAAATQ
jgi:hypothetical protein